MAGMLPPFVPPSARVSTQPLPLITEFVLDRGEQPVEQSFSAEQWEPPEPSSFESEATLPSIDEFLLREPVENEAESAVTTPHMEDTTEAVTEAETDEPTEEPTAEPTIVQTVVHVVQAVMETAIAPEPEAPETPESEPAAEPEAVQQEIAEEPSQQTELRMEPQTEPQMEPQMERQTAEAAAEVGGESWVREERDSFDWKGAAHLAVSGADERHASEEWSSTDWERPGASAQDRIVALLGQVARRVRSGELHIQGNRNMSAEAALAAVLAALLSEPDGR
ncbi:MAG: hypothetical protein ACR2GG_05585 [Gemmatimonadaceae bacterium]